MWQLGREKDKSKSKKDKSGVWLKAPVLHFLPRHEISRHCCIAWKMYKSSVDNLLWLLRNTAAIEKKKKTFQVQTVQKKNSSDPSSHSVKNLPRRCQWRWDGGGLFPHITTEMTAKKKKKNTHGTGQNKKEGVAIVMSGG